MLLVSAAIVVGELLYFFPVLSMARRTHCRWPAYEAYVYEREPGIEIHDRMSCEGCYELRPEHGEPIGKVDIWTINDTSGPWFDTVRTYGAYSRTSTWVQTAPPLPLDIEQRVVAVLTNDPEYAWLLPYQPGQPLRRSILWSGVIANAFSLMACVALAYGLPTGIRRWVRLARLSGERCPNCRYDTRGLPTDRCPECGKPFGV